MLPLPPPVFGLIDEPLQILCAKAVESIAHFLRMPVVRSGTIVGPNLNIGINVAPECNGVRSAITLFTLSVLLSRIRSLRLTAAILLAAIAIPLAYCANFMRLTGLFLMMHASGEPFMRYEHYFDLTSGGIWFFITVLVLLSIAQRLPRRTPRKAAS
jgi:exosortase/archaeosortase family protein